MSVNVKNYLSSLEKFENVISRYDDILDASIRNQFREEGFCSRSEAHEHLTSLQKEGRTLKIGVIGRVKAGKSSLINALLFDGNEVLPKAATPMTAALTSIGYAEKFTAEVHFFSPDDVALLKKKAHEFERQVARLITEFKEEHDKRAKEAKRPLPPVADEILRKRAVREIGQDGPLASAADLCERMKRSGLDVADLGESRVLEATSQDALNQELNEYVGASGRLMPFTRELTLGMPIDTLKGIEVVDTPGVNDPVKSREQRTYERLKDCNAAFIVSPAGQFLSQQDFELADRLSSREGTQEIYIVASQADTQLHSNVHKESKGIFPEALSKLQKVLVGQAQTALAGVENDVLTRIRSELSNRLIVTSGICETLLLGQGSSSDSTATHTLSLLKKNYSDYFSGQDDLMANLRLLSARDKLQQAVDTVRSKKEQIISQQAQSFIDAQWSTLQQVKEQVLLALDKRRSEVEQGDLAIIEADLGRLKAASANGIAAANNEFLNQAEEVRLKLPVELERVIQRAIDAVDEKSETASGEESETYRAKADGIFAAIARPFGGGYEQRTRTFATLKPLTVRRALEGFGRLTRNGMKDCATGSLLRWRANLISGLSRQLRDAMGDDSVDINRLQGVCRSVVTKMIDLPSVDIPELPAELAKSKKLTGSAVGDYLEAAQAYASVLEKQGYGFIETVKHTVDAIKAKNIGEELLSDLIDEMERLQRLVENKSLTLEKIERMRIEIREL
jgi:tRNA U34 5-carboxymethylaminomethyl modifying GTPase MnmE/TrmE